MDDPEDFIGKLNAGELVYYVEYYYYPGTMSPLGTDIEDGDLGIVTGIVVTVLGYTTYQILWLKAGIVTNVARANLKLAYTTKPN